MNPTVNANRTGRMGCKFQIATNSLDTKQLLHQASFTPKQFYTKHQWIKPSSPPPKSARDLPKSLGHQAAPIHSYQCANSLPDQHPKKKRVPPPKPRAHRFTTNTTVTPLQKVHEKTGSEETKWPRDANNTI